MKREQHGHSIGGTRSKEYRAWKDMKARCKYECRPRSKYNVGRGIKVCDRWAYSFLSFLADVGPAPSPEHTLDRKNNNGNYEPGNVHWVTRQQNSRNSRRPTLVTFRGETKSIRQWCIELGLKRRTVTRRIAQGQSPEEAFR